MAYNPCESTTFVTYATSRTTPHERVEASGRWTFEGSERAATRPSVTASRHCAERGRAPDMRGNGAVLHGGRAIADPTGIIFVLDCSNPP